ncbi:MAG: amidohydrolase family protein [Planctomycetes bacterium]|nr:amidohydrolase family protein [Planctomycetota bacterium]
MADAGSIDTLVWCPTSGERRGLHWADGSIRERAQGAPTIGLPEGACAVPGLIDGHLHLILGGLGLEMLDLASCTSRAEVERRVRARHATLEPGRWLLAQGWNEDRWGGEQPTAAWFDGLGDRNVVAWRMDHHACVVSRTVMARLDLSSTPGGGEIVRDAAGSPTGLLREAAAWHIAKPAIPAPSVDGRRRALDAAVRHLHALGVTGVGSMEYGVDLEHVLAPCRHDLPLRMAVTLLDRDWPLDVTQGVSFERTDRLWVVGYKSFIDGTLGSRTARMHAPYADEPSTRGLWTELAAEGLLRDWAEHVLANGLSPSMHAIGDAALTAALDALERDERRVGRIEHAQTARAEDIARCAGRIISMQPLHKADDAPSAPSRLGASRMDRFFRFRDFARAGARLVFGSDWPIVTCCPMAGMRAAITGIDRIGAVVVPEQSLTPTEALTAYTHEAARALGFPAGCGTLQAGAPADLTILDRDPRSADWVHAPPRVLMTIVGGEIVHRSS